MNNHLQSIWCTVRNNIVNDQQAIEARINQIKACKKEIKWLKGRVLANFSALSAMEGVRE